MSFCVRSKNNQRKGCDLRLSDWPSLPYICFHAPFGCKAWQQNSLFFTARQSDRCDLGNQSGSWEGLELLHIRFRSVKSRRSCTVLSSILAEWFLFETALLWGSNMDRPEKRGVLAVAALHESCSTRTVRNLVLDLVTLVHASEYWIWELGYIYATTCLHVM